MQRLRVSTKTNELCCSNERIGFEWHCNCQRPRNVCTVHTVGAIIVVAMWKRAIASTIRKLTITKPKTQKYHTHTKHSTVADTQHQWHNNNNSVIVIIHRVITNLQTKQHLVSLFIRVLFHWSEMEREHFVFMYEVLLLFRFIRCVSGSYVAHSISPFWWVLLFGQRFSNCTFPKGCHTITFNRF